MISKAKNKTSKKIKSAPVAVNTSANPPTKTLRSRGFFYVSEKPKGSGKWRVMFESWKDGKKTQTQVSKALLGELGLTPAMTQLIHRSRYILQEDCSSFWEVYRDPRPCIY